MSQQKKTTTRSVAKKPEPKAEKIIPKLLGMKDFFANEQLAYELIAGELVKLAKTSGFSEIRTPILESYNLYKKSTRRNNDQEFYFIEGAKSEKIVLRPELTQGSLRLFLENETLREAGLARFFSLGPVFRYEKLQAGHYRESTQFNLEIIGEKKPITEAVTMAVVYNFFQELKINVQLQINSLGTAECRKEYLGKLNAFYKERGRRAKLCAACKNSLGKNALSLLDCQESACVKEREEAPQIADYLSNESKEYFAKTLEYLDELGVNYNFNPHLVRGLNYYNDTVFEYWPINDKGLAQSRLALGGGGRYDSLANTLGGSEILAFGLSLGVERIMARLKDKQQLTKSVKEDIIFLAQLGDQAKIRAISLFQELKEAGFLVHYSFVTDSLKQQLEEASALQAKVCLILGKKEILDGTILMRDLESGAQETIVAKKIVDRLKRREKAIEKKLINKK